MAILEPNLAEKQGVIYVVATPIGNLEDISARALSILANVDFIAAEDTRHSQRLLTHYQISQKLVSLHEHNEYEKSHDLLNKILAGENMALISDAGTPLISDPGQHFIQAAVSLGIKIIPIPGACAAITALSAAGLNTKTFYFAGFLPAKSSHRKDVLHLLKNQSGTIILYEAPHRLLESLQDMLHVFGEHREIAVAKELTKQHEQIQKGSVQTLIAYFNDHPDKVRGEFVILIGEAEITEESNQDKTLQAEQLAVLLKNLPLKQAVQIYCELFAGAKNEIYELALGMKNS